MLRHRVDGRRSAVTHCFSFRETWSKGFLWMENNWKSPRSWRLNCKAMYISNTAKVQQVRCICPIFQSTVLHMDPKSQLQTPPTWDVCKRVLHASDFFKKYSLQEPYDLEWCVSISTSTTCICVSMKWKRSESLLLKNVESRDDNNMTYISCQSHSKDAQ